MFYQPFEPFELNMTGMNLSFKFLNLFLVNSSMTVCLVMTLIFVIFMGSVSSSYFVPNMLSYHSNALLLFAVSQVKNQLGRSITPWLSLFMFFFIFILFSNYFGLIPSSFTLTSHFNYVLMPTSSIFLGMTMSVFTDNFYSFMHHFVPAGIPSVIGVFLFGMEIISYLFSAMSLPVRVFANMVSGHVLLFLMATALYMNFEVYNGISLKMALIILLFIWFAVYHLELLVAYLQAYVFLTMISMYAKDMGFSKKHSTNYRFYVFKESFFSFMNCFFKLISKYPEYFNPDMDIKEELPKRNVSFSKFLFIFVVSIFLGYFMGMFLSFLF